MFLCQTCGIFQNNTRTFKEHIESHTGESVFCEKCGKYYLAKRSFYKHNETVHPIASSCEMCDKKFSNKYNLKRHIESLHEEKTFFCNTCEVKFKREDTLKSHQAACSSNGDYYKFLKLEQEGERLHHILKQLEKKFENVKDPSYKLYLIIREYENILKSDKSLFEKNKRK